MNEATSPSHACAFQPHSVVHEIRVSVRVKLFTVSLLERLVALRKVTTICL